MAKKSKTTPCNCGETSKKKTSPELQAGYGILAQIRAKLTRLAFSPILQPILGNAKAFANEYQRILDNWKEPAEIIPLPGFLESVQLGEVPLLIEGGCTLNLEETEAIIGRIILQNTSSLDYPIPGTDVVVPPFGWYIHTNTENLFGEIRVGRNASLGDTLALAQNNDRLFAVDISILEMCAAQPLGCVTIGNININARTAPFVGGGCLGQVPSGGIYNYYAIQADSGERFIFPQGGTLEQGQWYNIGYGVTENVDFRWYLIGDDNLRVWVRAGYQEILRNPNPDLRNEVAPNATSYLTSQVGDCTGQPLVLVDADCDDPGVGQPLQSVTMELQTALIIVLNCESGGDPEQALDIANVMQNRVEGNQFWDSWEEVLIEMNGWQCYTNLLAGTLSSSIEGINPRIITIADQLIKGILPPPNRQEFSYALFTIGFQFYGRSTPQPEQDRIRRFELTPEQVIELLVNNNLACEVSDERLAAIYVGYTLDMAGDNDGFGTAFFSDDPRCELT